MAKATLVFEDDHGGVNVTLQGAKEDGGRLSKAQKYALQCYHSFSMHIRARVEKQAANKANRKTVKK